MDINAYVNVVYHRQRHVRPRLGLTTSTSEAEYFPLSAIIFWLPTPLRACVLRAPRLTQLARSRTMADKFTIPECKICGHKFGRDDSPGWRERQNNTTAQHNRSKNHTDALALQANRRSFGEFFAPKPLLPLRALFSSPLLLRRRPLLRSCCHSTATSCKQFAVPCTLKLTLRGMGWSRS